MMIIADRIKTKINYLGVELKLSAIPNLYNQ